MDMINATGRRKSAVARVFLTEGTGKITINKRDLTEYFPSPILQYVVKQPLQLLGATEKYDIKVNIDGGGFTGQKSSVALSDCTRIGEDQCRRQESAPRRRLHHSRLSRC